jgi:enoyl-[acyl-carrier protein] reductase II
MSFDQLLHDNPICKLLGIQYPVMQAGMGYVAYGALAAAVSEAGGLGVIGAGSMEPQELRDEIDLVRSRTDKPFAVDILFGQVKSKGDSSARYEGNVQALIDITLEKRVPVLVSGLGDPSAVIDDAHGQGMTVMSVVGNVKQAKRMEEHGIDAVIASGADGGGHVGRVGTMALVPAAVDALRIPVVAGGGLADGRGLVAALALGACGVWMGTRFIATDEARGHINYKDKLVEIGDEGTVITRAHSGKTCRIVRNSFTKSWEGREAEIKPFPQQIIEVGWPASIKGRIEGDVDNGVLPAGQSTAMIHQIKPAGRIVLDVIEEARAVFQRWEQGRAIPSAAATPA